MASEIEAAAERMRSWFDDDQPDGHQYWGNDELEIEDKANVVTWCLARLAADRAEREERARLIDAEWLKSIGGDVPSGFDVALFFGGSVGVCRIADHWMCHQIPLATRGQLLDLLRVLKGGAE